MSSEASKETDLKDTNPHPTATTITVQVQYKEHCLMHYNMQKFRKIDCL